MEIDRKRVHDLMEDMFEQLMEHFDEEVIGKYELTEEKDGIGAEISSDDLYMRVFLPKDLICVRVGEA